jgi:hypothetical protein
LKFFVIKVKSLKADKVGSACSMHGIDEGRMHKCAQKLRRKEKLMGLLGGKMIILKWIERNRRVMKTTVFWVVAPYSLIKVDRENLKPHNSNGHF